LHLGCAQIDRRESANASRLGRRLLIGFQADSAKRLYGFAFSLAPLLACFVQ
jgi:hypothetical protein